jgi:carboxypeptidase family protein
MMRNHVVFVSLCLVLAGCDHAPEQRFCTAVAVDALTVIVTDAATGQRICDATVTATDGAFSAELRLFELGQDCSYSGPTERPGRYDVRVTRAGYEAVVRPDVTVTADECHVIPVRLDFALSPSPVP